jgi:hypothetical protein
MHVHLAGHPYCVFAKMPQLPRERYATMQVQLAVGRGGCVGKCTCQTKGIVVAVAPKLISYGARSKQGKATINRPGSAQADTN